MLNTKLLQYIIYLIILYIFAFYVNNKLKSVHYVVCYSFIIAFIFYYIDSYFDKNIEKFSQSKNDNIKCYLNAFYGKNHIQWDDISANNNNFHWVNKPVWDKVNGYNLTKNRANGNKAKLLDINENGEFTIIWNFNTFKTDKIDKKKKTHPNIMPMTAAITTLMKQEQFVDYTGNEKNLISIPGLHNNGIEINYNNNNIIVNIGNEKYTYNTGDFNSPGFYTLIGKNKTISLFKNYDLIKTYNYDEKFQLGNENISINKDKNIEGFIKLFLVYNIGINNTSIKTIINDIINNKNILEKPDEKSVHSKKHICNKKGEAYCFKKPLNKIQEKELLKNGCRKYSYPHDHWYCPKGSKILINKSDIINKEHVDKLGEFCVNNNHLEIENNGKIKKAKDISCKNSKLFVEDENLDNMKGNSKEILKEIKNLTEKIHNLKKENKRDHDKQDQLQKNEERLLKLQNNISNTFNTRIDTAVNEIKSSINIKNNLSEKNIYINKNNVEHNDEKINKREHSNIPNRNPSYNKNRFASRYNDSNEKNCPKLPDMSKYIRKDKIPCWGCNLE